MALFVSRSEGYSRAELISDAVVHVTALVAALAAVPVLITLAAVWRGDAGSLWGLCIYGTSLIAMILCSLLYNHIANPGWTWLLRRLDHSAIYLKIAGTYTPFAALSGGAGLTLLAGIWGAAAAGTGIAVFAPRRAYLFGVPLCLAMGWAIVLGGGDLLAVLSPTVIVLILIGGVLYTVGVVFLLAEGLRFHNTIWHVFVMVASLFFFIAVMVHLVQTSPIGTANL
ncbi:MAG: hemolysin III family protein [Pseudomonadota bacterium]